MSSNFRNPNAWTRTGRGHEVQFLATDEEIQHWISDSLPPHECFLIGHDRITAGREWRDEPFISPASEYASAKNGHSGVRLNLWIWCRAIGPAIHLGATLPDDASCSLSGLILLQPVKYVDMVPGVPGRIAIVTQVQHLGTGQLVECTEYKAMYEKLRRRITADLRYRTMRRFPNGSEVVDRVVRMSAGAAALWRSNSSWRWRPLTD